MHNKPIIVQKYGGTSVADVQKIMHVARNVITTKDKGYDLLVVVSAMAGETNRLLELAKISGSTRDLEALDIVASTGEQVTVGLLSLALKSLGASSIGYCGWQSPIITDNMHAQARIKSINTDRVKQDLYQGKIVIVAGFQGLSTKQMITTLGRGGSDTSAVALAVSLNALECQIYTDVNGVYSADPNKVTTAQRLEQIDGKLMLEAASLGAKVLHVRSCELGFRYKTNIRVLSTFAPHDQGTLVMNDHDLESYPIVNLSTEENQALVSFDIISVANSLGKILQEIYACNIVIDMLQIHQNHISFVIVEENSSKIEETLNKLKVNNLYIIHNLTKISLIGSGFRSNSEINQEIWSVLSGVEIFATTHNEISLSFLVHQLNIASVRTKLTHLLNK